LADVDVVPASCERQGATPRGDRRTDARTRHAHLYPPLFHQIGEELGEDVYGKCWKWLRAKREFRRINYVPYLWMRDLRAALEATVGKKERAKVAKIFGSQSVESLTVEFARRLSGSRIS